MEYLIGIDGGGSKTKCILTTSELKKISSVVGSASNPLADSFENSAIIISELILKLTKKIKQGAEIRIVAGIAGCGRNEHALKLRKMISARLKKNNLGVKKIKIVSDAEIALEAAAPEGPGALLIAGTGSILFGRNYKGETIKIGGYGKYYGDEGGGYTIGIKVINLCSKYLDGRGGSYYSAKFFKDNFGIKKRDELISLVYSGSFNPSVIAEHIIKDAGRGNKFCREILNDGLSELFEHVLAYSRTINGEKFTLSLSGGLLSGKNYYSTELKKLILKLLPNISINMSKPIPEIGAVLLAKKL